MCINTIFYNICPLGQLKSFKVKNNKIFNLIKRKLVPKYPEHKVPIINLSSHQLLISTIKIRFEHSFINKDKNVKKYNATHMESFSLCCIEKSRKHLITKFL